MFWLGNDPRAHFLHAFTGVANTILHAILPTKTLSSSRQVNYRPGVRARKTWFVSFTLFPPQQNRSLPMILPGIMKIPNYYSHHVVIHLWRNGSRWRTQITTTKNRENVVRCVKMLTFSRHQDSQNWSIKVFEIHQSCQKHWCEYRSPRFLHWPRPLMMCRCTQPRQRWVTSLN